MCVCVYVCARVYAVLVQRTHAHTHHRSKIFRQTPTTHIISTIEPLYLISIKYSSSLPDDRSYVNRNMLEYFNVSFRLLCKIDFNVYDCYN